MAAGLTDYGKQQVANALWGGQPLGNPTTWLLDLYTAAPTAAGGGTVCNYTNYAAVAVPADITNFPSAGGSGTVSILQAVLQQFATNGDPVTYSLVGWTLSDANGNPWFYGQFTPVNLLANLAPQLPPNSITISLVSLSSTSGLTDYGAAYVLNALLNGAAWAPPTEWHVSLVTSPGTPALAGTETTYPNYNRTLFVPNQINCPPATGATNVTITLTKSLTFQPNGGGSAVTIVGLGFWGQATGGNRWLFGPLAANITVQPGQSPQLLPNTVQLVLSA